MTPEEINSATQALQTAVATQTVAQGAAIDAAAGQKAAGLNTGTNSVGGYNYERFAAPVVDPIQKGLVLAAKQAVLKQALKDNVNTAQVAYDDANYGMRARQREYQRQEALAAKRRQAQQDAAQASALLSAQGGATYGGVKTTAIPVPRIEQKNGGYNFFDAGGKAITWQKYQELTGENVSSLINTKSAAPAAAQPAASNRAPVKIQGLPTIKVPGAR